MSTTSRLIPEADLASLQRTSPRRESIHRSSSVSAKAGGPLRFFTNARWIGWLGLLACWPAAAATLLVWPASPNPTTPYRDWATAAHTIQDAVDAAAQGDTVLVTNGVYATGGRAVSGTMTNRVVVRRPLVVRSVNGPGLTVIEGYQVPGMTNGDGAVRCVYLTNAAVVSGFTLTQGATLASGDFAREQSGGAVFCASTNARVTNCIITGNAAARYGGGAYAGTLNNCTLTGNSATNGGGAYQSRLSGCALTRNSAVYGGGAYLGTLNNCTLTANSASQEGGGATGCGLTNSILYYNSAARYPNYSGRMYLPTALNYCCTTPLPSSGAGNIDAEPQLSSASHISANSPCRGAGSSAYATGVDIDGELWLDPPSIGCDEYRTDDALTVAIDASCTNVAVGFAVDLTGWISGRVSASVWDFGDGTILNNRPFASHAWRAAGDYPVVLRAYSDSHPEGVSAAVTIRVVAPVHYVSAQSDSPVPPYSSWETAAWTIQAAVDAATVPGALVLVTNGVYARGGRAIVGTITNRVAVDRPVMVRSVNGPTVTAIQGEQALGTTNGDGAIRCVYLADRAVLSGFTLTNGASGTGGGVWCESTKALITNCTLTGNLASQSGGGACGGMLNHCTLTANSAGYGGGAVSSTLNNCTLTDNHGGGAGQSTLNNCTLSGNSADNGGASYSCTLNNCTLTGNSASWYGGGAWVSTLNNCALVGNSARFGGGACYGTLNNCTLTGNSADQGGGAYGCGLSNCLLYYNTANAESNHYLGTLNYCCTTPLPTTGVGNIDAEPQLASDSHLSAGSPCRGAGSAAYATGADIDGERWLNPPSIGCDEYWSGAVTGALTVAIRASWTNVAAGFAVNLTGWISGRVSTSEWDFGDGTGLSNRPFASHSWAAPGDYAVVVRAYNEDHPEGVSATVTVRVEAQPVHYVSVGSASPVPPYRSWETAARTIQDALDAAVPGGEVLVTNGVYATGGRAVYGTMTNRAAVMKPLTLRSVNGPADTVIQGYQVPGTTNGDGAIRCVYLTNGAVLSGFTFTRGATRTSGDYSWERNGGGVWCASTNAVVTNCVLADNLASQNGGGAYGGTLNHCTLTGNSAYYGGAACDGALNNCTLMDNSAVYGGGAFLGWLNNCTLTGNSAEDGGGTYGGTLGNCIAYYNTANSGLNYSASTLNYCCTTPLPSDGVGNITAEPLFVDLPNGDLRLQSTSPCINAGNNAYVTDTTDLEGNPRIVGDTVDLGAYEFQTPTSLLFHAWLQQYGLPTDGSADYTDPDSDGLNNWLEWLYGTDPTNALSALSLFPPTIDASGVTLSWVSITNHTYFLERAAELGAQPVFLPLATGIAGRPGTTTFTDTNAPGVGPGFYRVGIQP